MKRWWWCAGVAVWPGVAQAQELPGSIDPGRIQEEIRPPTPARPEVELELPPVPQPEPQPGSIDIRFRLQGVEIRGSTVLSAEVQEEFYRDFLDQEVSLTDIYEIAARLQRWYQQQGYFLTRVFVPEQVIREGNVLIQVVEGFIEDINFTDRTHLGIQRRLQPYLAKLKKERPLRLATLERYLLLMNDLSGFVVQASLGAGQEVGGVVLVLEGRRKLVTPYIEANSWATQTVGPVRMQGGVVLSSPFYQGGSLRLSGSVALPQPEELTGISGGFSWPIGSEGLQLTGGVSYVRTRPGADLRRFKLQGTSFSANLGLSYPLVRSQRENLSVSLEAELIHSRNETRLLGEPVRLYDDRLRRIRAELAYQRASSLGVTSLRVGVSQGLPWGARFGNNQVPLSRAHATPTALRMDLTASHSAPLPGGLLLSGTFTGQLATAPLTATEQFALGGPEFGSAYPTATISGDSGWAIRAQLERPWPAVSPYLFLDYGQVYRLRPLPVESHSQHLASTGIGLRLNVRRRLSQRLEIAFPLSPADHPRLAFSLQGVF